MRPSNKVQEPTAEPPGRGQPKSLSRTLRVSFLDDDHVLRLIRQILEAQDEAAWGRATEFFWPEAPQAEDMLALRAGVDVSVGPLSTDTDVLVFRRGSVPRTTIDALHNLRFIQRIGTSTARVDIGAARSRGIEMSFLRRRGIELAAEHTIMLMLALVKRVLVGDRAVRQVVAPADHDARVSYNWPGLTGISGLSDKVLGIVGLGEVGTLVARLARALGMTVVYANRRRLGHAREAELGVKHLPMPDLLRTADIVSLHVPGGGDTPVLGRAEIDLLSSNAYVVNTSRGWMIDEEALVEALVRGRLAGAALDVHSREPRIAGDRLLEMDNVILTPHVAGGSRLGVLDEVRDVFDNLRHVMVGEPPEHGRWRAES